MGRDHLLGELEGSGELVLSESAGFAQRCARWDSLKYGFSSGFIVSLALYLIENTVSTAELALVAMRAILAQQPSLGSAQSDPLMGALATVDAASPGDGGG